MHWDYQKYEISFNENQKFTSCCHSIKIQKGPGKLVSSLHNRAKYKLGMFAITY